MKITENDRSYGLFPFCGVCSVTRGKSLKRIPYI